MDDEKRADPKDGQFYTKQEFLQYYNGLDEWNKAEPERRVDPLDGKKYTKAEFEECYAHDAPAKWGKAAMEHRVDPADGRAYTKEDFVKHYREIDQWDRAKPIAAQSPPPETRKARDGNVYTLAQFYEYYKGDAAAEWESAGGQSSPLPVEEKRASHDGHKYSKKEFQEYFGAAWKVEWDAAAPPTAVEKRVDADGKPYTKDEFMTYHGTVSGEDRWQAAGRGGKRSPTSDAASDWMSPKKATEKKAAAKKKKRRPAESDSDSSSEPPRTDKQKFTDGQRYVLKKATDKAKRHSRMQHYYMPYTAEEALLWELRAAFAGVVLQFTPEKAILPECTTTTTWECKKKVVDALVEAGEKTTSLKDTLKELFKSFSKSPAAALLKQCGLQDHQERVMEIAKERNVLTPGVLLVSVSGKVIRDIETETNGSAVTLQPAGKAIQKDKIWLSPFPLKATKRFEFQTELRSLICQHLTKPDLQSAVKAVLGTVPLWWKEDRCAWPEGETP